MKYVPILLSLIFSTFVYKAGRNVLVDFLGNNFYNLTLYLLRLGVYFIVSAQQTAVLALQFTGLTCYKNIFQNSQDCIFVLMF